MEKVLHDIVLPAAAVARQEHNSNGSVLLSFDAYLMAPMAGEAGTLTVAVQDGSGPWNATQNVSLPTTGENKATVQVGWAYCVQSYHITAFCGSAELQSGWQVNMARDHSLLSCIRIALLWD